MSSLSKTTGAPQTPQEGAEFITLKYTKGRSSQGASANFEIKKDIVESLAWLDDYVDKLRGKAKTREYRMKIAALVKQKSDIPLLTADTETIIDELLNLKAAAEKLEAEMENAQKRSELKVQLQSLLDAATTFHVEKMFKRLLSTDDLADFEKIRAKADKVNLAAESLETLLDDLERNTVTNEHGREVDALKVRYEIDFDLENNDAAVLTGKIGVLLREAEDLKLKVDSVKFLTDLDDKTLPSDLRNDRKTLIADFSGGGTFFRRKKEGAVLQKAFRAFEEKVTRHQAARGRLEDRVRRFIAEISTALDGGKFVPKDAETLSSKAGKVLEDPARTDFDFTELAFEFERFRAKGEAAYAKKVESMKRREQAVREGNRIAQEALFAVQEGDTDDLFERADEIDDGIRSDLEDGPEGIDPKWQRLLEELQVDVARERAERADSLRLKIAEAISTVSQTPLIGAEERAKGLSLDAEIQQARAEIARLIEQRARRKRAAKVAEQADEAAAYVEIVAANAENNRLDLGERLENAEAAQAAVTSERRLLQGVLQILDRVEDQDLYALYDARLRNLRDYAPLVAATRAAYLRQLESERKEGVAQKLRAGEVPLGAAPEPAEAPKPLRDAEQEKAAHELARFMREEPLWYDVYEKWKLHWRRCVNGHRFLEIDNVGSWACRQHALPFDQRAQRFPCCDKAERDPGCVRADHRVTEAPLTEAHNISGVKDLILRAMEGDRPGRAPPGDFVRFDRAEHARRARPVIHWKERPSSKTVSVLLPDFLTLERDPADENRVLGGAAPADMWLWDWAAPRPETTAAPPAGAPVSARIIYLDQLSEFIYHQTKDTVTFKVALLVEDVPVLFQHGRRGVPYRTHPHRPLEFTPLERVRLWASSPR